jgi:O-antigen/teichoic acid export membrane protein
VVMLAAAILNGGLGLAAVPALRHGEVSLRRMLRAQGLWIAAGTILIALLLAAGGRGLPAALAREHLGWEATTAAWAWAAVAALLAFDIFFYDLLASGRLVAGPLINLGRASGQLLLLLAAALAGVLDLAAAVAVFAVMQLLAAGTVRLLLRPGGAAAAALPVAGPDDALPLRRLARRTLRRGWHGQISAVASLLHLRLDLAIVSAFWDSATVGVYAFAVLVGELLWHLPGALSPLLVYASADDAHPAERDRLAARAVRVALGATVAAAVPLALLAGPGLDWLFGGKYAASAPALRALLPGIVAFAPGAVLAGDFIGRGRPIWNAQASLITVLVNVGCGLWWIPRGGALGAALASSVAYAAGAAVMIGRFRRVTRLPLRALLLPSWRDFR